MEKMRQVIADTFWWTLLLLVTFLVGYGGWQFVGSVYKACTADPLDINRDGEVNLTDVSVYMVKVQENNSSTPQE